MNSNVQQPTFNLGEWYGDGDDLQRARRLAAILARRSLLAARVMAAWVRPKSKLGCLAGMEAFYQPIVLTFRS